MALNHSALDNWHHRLEAASQPVVYNFGLSVVTAAHLFSRMCNVGETWHFFPPVFPLVKLFSKCFIHCSTKYLLSSFLVPSSKTKKSNPILVPRMLPVQNRQLNKLPCLFPGGFSQEACSPKTALWLFFSRLWDLSLFILYCRLPSGSVVKNPPAMRESQDIQVQSLCQEDPQEAGTATHSCVLAWRFLWTEEPGGLQSMGSPRVKCDWSDSACMHAYFIATLLISSLRRYQDWNDGLWVRKTWIWNLGLFLVCCETMKKLHNLSEPQSSSQGNECNSAHLLGLLWKLNELNRLAWKPFSRSVASAQETVLNCHDLNHGCNYVCNCALSYPIESYSLFLFLRIYIPRAKLSWKYWSCNFIETVSSLGPQFPHL